MIKDVQIDMAMLKNTGGQKRYLQIWFSILAKIRAFLVSFVTALPDRRRKTTTKASQKSKSFNFLCERGGLFSWDLIQIRIFQTCIQKSLPKKLREIDSVKVKPGVLKSVEIAKIVTCSTCSAKKLRENDSIVLEEWCLISKSGQEC